MERENSMKDENRTKLELIRDLKSLRRRVKKLEGVARKVAKQSDLRPAIPLENQRDTKSVKTRDTKNVEGCCTEKL